MKTECHSKCCGNTLALGTIFENPINHMPLICKVTDKSQIKKLQCKYGLYFCGRVELGGRRWYLSIASSRFFSTSPIILIV